MPFPTSPSNNDVHKIGNRAFVYDSALGTWDQVKETDRAENKILSGEIGGGTTLTNATFPAGHIINAWSFRNTITANKTMTLGGSAWEIVDYGSADGATGQIKITGITATENNLLYMTTQPGEVYAISDASYSVMLGFDIDGSKYPVQNTYYNQSTSHKGPGNFSATFLVPASFTNKTISVRADEETGYSFTSRMQTYRTIPSSNSGTLISFTIFEIQQ